MERQPSTVCSTDNGPPYVWYGILEFNVPFDTVYGPAVQFGYLSKVRMLL